MKCIFFFVIVLLSTISAAGYDKAHGLYRDCEYAQAFDLYTNVLFVTNVKYRDGLLAQSVLDASRCLTALNRANEVEAFLERVRARYDEFAVRLACVQALKELPKRGMVKDGVFIRGECKGMYSALERDRVMRLVWLEELMPKVGKQSNLRQRWFWNEMIEAIADGARTHGDSWKMNDLTHLAVLPNICRASYFEVNGVVLNSMVDFIHGIVFYECVKEWADAKNDGERWMFANERRANVDYIGRKKSAAGLARFSSSHFGTRTLSHSEIEQLQDELAALRDDESLFCSTRGVVKIKLPSEYNYIRLWHESENYSELSQEYLRRHQYKKAEEMLLKMGLTNSVNKTSNTDKNNVNAHRQNSACSK